MPLVSWYAFRSARQASRAEDNLAAKVLREQQNTFWTITLWAGEAAMKQFLTSGTHGKAMRKLIEWCDEAAVVHWTQDNAASPTWPEAYQRLQKDGRRSTPLCSLCRCRPASVGAKFRLTPVSGRTQSSGTAHGSWGWRLSLPIGGSQSGLRRS
jgi:hypothetical protein